MASVKYHGISTSETLQPWHGSNHTINPTRKLIASGSLAFKDFYGLSRKFSDDSGARVLVAGDMGGVLYMCYKYLENNLLINW